jgi:flagellar motor switch protein FliM
MSTANRESAISVLRGLAQAAGGGTGRAIHTDVAFTEYDWNAPASFSRPQLDKIDVLAATLAKVLSEPLARHLRRPVKLHAAPAVLRFGRQLQQDLDAAKQFRLTLGTGAQPRGLLIVPSAAGLGWVARLLGGGDAEQEDKALSELESGLLADMVTILVAAVSETIQKAGAAALSQIGEISAAPGSLPEGTGDAEYCCLSFQESQEDATPVLRLALISDVLATVAQAAAAGAAAAGAGAGAASAQAARAALTDHFGSFPIPLQAIGWDTELTMRDVMGLEVGDVVILPTQPGDPIELRAGGKCVSLGYAVVAEGHYAIELSEVFTGRATPAPAAAPAGKSATPVQRKGK